MRPKCLFLYFLVAVLAIKFAWIFVLPVWAVATKMHWTTATRFVYLLNYFLPIFALSGFLIGLLPFHRLRTALTEIAPGLARFTDPHTVPAIFWAWVPVTLAFLVRFFTWESRNASVLAETTPLAASPASSEPSTSRPRLFSTRNGHRTASSSPAHALPHGLRDRCRPSPHPNPQTRASLSRGL